MFRLFLSHLILNTMEPSQFASPLRSSPEEVARDHLSLMDDSFIAHFFEAMPFVACVLNEHRQLVLSNKALLDVLELVNQADLLGARPGELLGCVHARNNQGGCGTTEACRYCGAGTAIVESQATGKTISYECRVRTLHGTVPGALDLRVKASPFSYGGKVYTILALEDLSSEKRRRVLEKVFYHDIINAAGGLRGLIGLLPKIEDPAELGDMHAKLHTISEGLLEEIIEQRDLSAAETGELVSNRRGVKTIQVLSEALELIRHHEVRRYRSLVSHLPGVLPEVHTDPVILRRVVLNMLKNAFEACPREGTVIVDHDEGKPGYLGIRVHNPGVIPREIQLQIFQRSFSTKGNGRGLGTYSMKLFAETVLGGSIEFISDPEHETVFTLWIPRS